MPLVPMPIKKSINPYKRLIIGVKIYFIILVFIIVNKKYAKKAILVRIIRLFIFYASPPFYKFLYIIISKYTVINATYIL
jgi:hypothetical protein